MMNRSKFAPPRVPQPRPLPTYRDYRICCEDLLLGLGFQIKSDRQAPFICVTEYECVGAIAYVSAINERIGAEEIQTLIEARHTLGVAYAINVSASGFTQEALEVAERHKVFLYTLRSNKELFAWTELSGLLTTMGSPALSYGIVQGKEEIMNIIAEMYPQGRSR